MGHDFAAVISPEGPIFYAEGRIGRWWLEVLAELGGAGRASSWLVGASGERLQAPHAGACSQAHVKMHLSFNSFIMAVSEAISRTSTLLDTASRWSTPLAINNAAASRISARFFSSRSGRSDETGQPRLIF